MRTKIGSLVLTLMIVCVSTTISKAQVFSGGISAGVSTTSVKISSIDNALVDVINGDNIFGVEAGIYGKFKFGPLYGKPMLLASYSSGQVDITNLDGTAEETDFSFGRIMVPVLLGLNVVGPLNLEGGPVWNFVYYEKFANDVVQVSQRGMGYRVGANAEFDKLLLGIHYQGLFNNSNANDVATFRAPNTLIFSVGIRLGDEGGEDADD
jgi:hypothetical protein